MVHFVRAIFKIILGIFYKVDVINKEYVPDKGGAIICSNHLGQLDMFLICYKIKRLAHYMAKEELFKNRILSAVITKLGAFPVKRGKGDVGAIKTALKLIKEEHIVGIFPEGTRTRGKSGNNIRIKPGIAMLAIHSKAPIIPVLITGNYKFFSKIKIVFGKPFYLDIVENKKYTIEEMEEISRNIMSKVYSLSGGN